MNSIIITRSQKKYMLCRLVHNTDNRLNLYTQYEWKSHTRGYIPEHRLSSTEAASGKSYKHAHLYCIN